MNEALDKTHPTLKGAHQRDGWALATRTKHKEGKPVKKCSGLEELDFDDLRGPRRAFGAPGRVFLMYPFQRDAEVSRILPAHGHQEADRWEEVADVCGAPPAYVRAVP